MGDFVGRNKAWATGSRILGKHGTIVEAMYNKKCHDSLRRFHQNAQLVTEASMNIICARKGGQNTREGSGDSKGELISVTKGVLYVVTKM